MSANNYTGNVTVLTFGNLKQITITESLGVGKNTLIAQFPCNSSKIFVTQVGHHNC